MDCLQLLIQSHVYICDYQYIAGVAALHHMHCVLKEWHDSIENQQNSNNRFSLTSTSPLNFFKTPAKPALYTFYSKFHELLVAKVCQGIAHRLLSAISVPVFSVFFGNALRIWGSRGSGVIGQDESRLDCTYCSISSTFKCGIHCSRLTNEQRSISEQ
jgi:hypothetical protein